MMIAGFLAGRVAPGWNESAAGGGGPVRKASI